MSTDIRGQDDLDNDLSDANMSTLRALAKAYGIKAQRDWSREDFVREITAKQDASDEPVVLGKPLSAEEEADAIIARYSLPPTNPGHAVQGPPKPGYARVIIHKDPTPDHANTAVMLSLNGRLLNIPRGVPSDIPIPFLGVLRDAVHVVIRQKREPSANNPEGEIVEDHILSYPFQITAVTPGGSFVNPNDQRSVNAMRRQAFCDDVGKYPTHGELLEWEKEQRAIKREEAADKRAAKRA